MGCPCAGKDTKQEIGVNIPLKSVSVAGYSLGLMGGVPVSGSKCALDGTRQPFVNRRLHIETLQQIVASHCHEF